MTGGRWAVLLLLLLAACGQASTPTDAPVTDAPVGQAPVVEAPSGAVAPEAVEGEVLVFAAASLADAFDRIAETFTEANPEANVTFNYAGSQALATQLTEGAPADVFASANARQMKVAADAGLLDGEAEVFTSNLLAIAVEPGNPLGVAGLEDLADPDVTLVLAAPEVPAGQYAVEALASTGVTVTPSSLENDVRAVLSRVELGEADAGIVYASDVTSAGDSVEGVAIPAAQNIVATYPIAALDGAPNPAGAAAFVALVRSEEGQAVLAEFGFTAP